MQLKVIFIGILILISCVRTQKPVSQNNQGNAKKNQNDAPNNQGDILKDAIKLMDAAISQFKRSNIPIDTKSGQKDAILTMDAPIDTKSGQKDAILTMDAPIDTKSGQKDAAIHQIKTQVIQGNPILMSAKDKQKRWQKYKNDMKKNKINKMADSEETYRRSVYQGNMDKILKKSKKIDWEEGETPFTMLTNQQFKSSYLSFVPDMKNQKLKKQKKSKRLLATTTVVSNISTTNVSTNTIQSAPNTTTPTITPTTAPSTATNDTTNNLINSLTNFAVIPTSGISFNYKSVNWSNISNIVIDQGSCGACWAFTAANVIESSLYLKNKTIKVTLSAQQMIDCVKDYDGCNGGDYPEALNFAITTGLKSNLTYPFLGQNGQCRIVKSPENYKIKSYVQLPNDCQNLRIKLLLRPIAVAVDSYEWANYKSGIMNGTCQGINHAVTLVGAEKNYWIVKNVWGTDWGENGYIRIKISDLATDIDNFCICTYAFYPVI